MYHANFLDIIIIIFVTCIHPLSVLYTYWGEVGMYTWKRLVRLHTTTITKLYEILLNCSTCHQTMCHWPIMACVMLVSSSKAFLQVMEVQM